MPSTDRAAHSLDAAGLTTFASRPVASCVTLAAGHEGGIVCAEWLFERRRVIPAPFTTGSAFVSAPGSTPHVTRRSLLWCPCPARCHGGCPCAAAAPIRIPLRPRAWSQPASPPRGMRSPLGLAACVAPGRGPGVASSPRRWATSTPTRPKFHTAVRLSTVGGPPRRASSFPSGSPGVGQHEHSCSALHGSPSGSVRASSSTVAIRTQL